MKIMYCWRCKQDVPMLDDDEYEEIYKLYGECFYNRDKSKTIDERFQPVSDEYERMTGVANCHYNAIMHHKISRYGEPCSQCGKPLRTPQASYCVYCGKKAQE